MHPRASILGPLAALSLASFSPVTAHAAQGVGLAWNHCFGEAGAVQNAVFACDTNAGLHSLHGTFRLAAPMSIVVGVEIVVDLAAPTATLPAWWEYRNDGTCRQASMSFQSTPEPADLGCVDWGQGLDIGGIGGYCTLANAMPIGCGLPGQPANRARIKMITAVVPSDAQDLLADQDYFAFALRFDHAKTVGSGACGGCDVPVCIVFNSVNVVGRDNYEQRMITSAFAPGGNAVAWQGGGAGGLPGCLAATAARKSTWGGLKSLYR